VGRKREGAIPSFLAARASRGERTFPSVQRGFELSIPRGSLPSVPLVARSGGDLGARASDQGFLPIETGKYLMLLDWTGREIRADKRGAIPDHLAPLLDRLGLDRSNWVNTVRNFGRMFKQAAGRASSLARAAPGCSRRWFQGKAAAQTAFLQGSGLMPRGDRVEFRAWSV
jgi:hypothetical protein